MGRVAVVNLGQHDEPDRRGHRGHPVEEIVDLRLDHEAGGAGLLDHVADRVQADDPDTVRREGRKPVCRINDRAAWSRSGPGRSVRPVGCPERRPDPFPLAGFLDRDGRKGVRLAQKDPRDIFGGRFAVRPDLVERDEQVRGETVVPSKSRETPGSSRRRG